MQSFTSSVNTFECYWVCFFSHSGKRLCCPNLTPAVNHTKFSLEYDCLQSFFHLPYFPHLYNAIHFDIQSVLYTWHYIRACACTACALWAHSSEVSTEHVQWVPSSSGSSCCITSDIILSRFWTDLDHRSFSGTLLKDITDVSKEPEALIFYFYFADANLTQL